MSQAIYAHELPIAIPGGAPLTISDDLQAAALANQSGPARRAINAGLDLLLYAQTERASAEAYTILLGEARRGLLRGERISAASRRISTLKRLLGR
jgi:beta-glucosidase-like glycosyl hydrolase